MEKKSFYRYALNKANEIVHISTVNENNRHSGYRCFSCGSELTPALGKKNVHHFRHKTDICNFESYIHKLWKNYFFEQWKKKQHLYISYSIEHSCDIYNNCKLRHVYDSLKCDNRVDKKIIDLKEIYDTCEIEGSCGQYRADILLSNSSNPQINPALIEICYKHPCEEEKQSSGLLIVELYVEDDNLSLPSYLTESKEIATNSPFCKINIYGVEKKKKIPDQNVIRFSAYQDVNGVNHGMVCNGVITCSRIDNHLPQSKLELFALEKMVRDKRQFLKLGINESMNHDFPIRHCINCSNCTNCQLLIRRNEETWNVKIIDTLDTEFDNTNCIYICNNYQEIPPPPKNDTRTIPYLVWNNQFYIRKTTFKPDNFRDLNITKERLSEIATEYSFLQ